MPTASQTQLADQCPQESRAPTSDTTGPFLYNLKPLFPPAPFVPSHPVFAHLSSIAAKASEHLRSLAEEQIAVIVRDKFAELEKANGELRQDVEKLWLKFVENVSEAEKQIGPKNAETRRRDGSRGLSLLTSGVSGTPLVSVRNFVPTPNTAPRTMSPSSSLPRISSLSASLATSGSHHVGMVQESAETRERSPPPYSSHPSSLDSAEGSISSSLQSSPELSPRLNGDNVVQPFRRSMDETRDTAASFRYFTILEADVARARQQQTQPNTRREGVPKSVKENGDSNAAKVTTSAKETEEAHAHPPENSDRGVISPTDGTPRRRKVQFDIKAETVTGEGASSGVDSGSQEHEGDGYWSRPFCRELTASVELIFDLEDGTSDPETSDAAPILPFIENAQTRRRGRYRVASLGTLPASLSSLRPPSLPAYSVHSTAAQEPATSESNSSASHTTPSILLLQGAQSKYPEQLDPQEEEILKLVAANTPSHRSAWKRDSKAWQLFVSRGRSGVPGALIPEETEDGSGRAANNADDSDWGTSRGKFCRLAVMILGS